MNAASKAGIFLLDPNSYKTEPDFSISVLTCRTTPTLKRVASIHRTKGALGLVNRPQLLLALVASNLQEVPGGVLKRTTSPLDKAAAPTTKADGRTVQLVEH